MEKKIKSFVICILFSFLMFNICVCANAEAQIYTFGDASVSGTEIKIGQINGENVLVLPSTVSPDSVMLCGEFPSSSEVFMEGTLKSEAFLSGQAINLNDFCADGEYNITFSDKNGAFEEFTVKFLFSENVPTVYLVSDNPEEKGRAWVEESADKSNKATGFMVMQTADGETVYNGELTQIKGRGNSTWSEIKKPYQIKTASKADLLQTGNSENKSKTWVLLANYLDPSLLNNTVVLNMGKALGMRTNIESTHVDLYYDGEYRGSYLLAEKAEVGDGRVAVEDLEEKNEEANIGVDTEKLPVKTAVTENGAEFTYCEGMASPADITGGYLLEMDYEVRALEEICYFRTTRGQYIVVKSPEYASKEEMEYIASLYQEYEDAVYNGGVNPYTGKAYSDYVDSESIACYYLLNEFSKARDFFGSSAYLNKNAGEDKMYMGPLWDYDLSFTESRYDTHGEEVPYGMSVYNTDFGAKLLEIDGFCDLLKNMYNDRLLPLIKDCISDDEDGQGELSLNSIREKTAASAALNSALWYNGLDREKKADELARFIEKRAAYLDEMLNLYPEINHGEHRFRDVLPVSWYYDEVNEISSLGYMNGVSQSYFDPYSNVKRSEAAQVIFNMSGAEEAEYEQQFSDVQQDDWFFGAVSWAVNNEIMQGNDDGSFGAAQYITREELICTLYRYEKEPYAESGALDRFADGADISASAKNAFEWAVGKNILQGDGNNRLNPEERLTRAELAAILTRLQK